MFAIPLVIGFLIDCVLGDPYTLPHPVRAIGTLISRTEGLLRKNAASEKTAGIFLVLIVLFISTAVPSVILFLMYKLHMAAGIIAEGIMCYYLIAAKCLKDESMKVHSAVCDDDTEKARSAVSMIVGRDTAVLDRNGIIRAAVETVAENTSDGVTAPIMYMMIGGAPLGFFYKAANTMDSMVGYKNDKYIKFGRTAAKLDDVLNYIPSRLTALLMILSAYILGYDGRNAYRIWKRDRRNHASPNSAQTEAVTAGALNIRLAGNAYYFGKLYEKPYIGDDDREIENDDIIRANRLMYAAGILTLIICSAVRMALCILIFG